MGTSNTKVEHGHETCTGFLDVRVKFKDGTFFRGNTLTVLCVLVEVW